ncbi:MAG: YIP1 family protein [Candidatus Aenigmatarchaeota archaeon]
MERIKEILLNPLIAINKAKKEKDLNKTLLILILSWILVGLSFILVFYKTTTILMAFGSALTVFLFGILFSIFYSYIANIIMNILGGKGKYYESLTAATYSSLPISFGILLTAIISSINSMLGGFLGFIIIAITAALSLSIYFKAIKEFYLTDMLTTFVGFLIIIYVFIIAVYVSVAFSMSSTFFSNFQFKIF